MSLPLTPLDREIAQLRERLEGAEEMRRVVGSESRDERSQATVVAPVALLAAPKPARASAAGESSAPATVTVSEAGNVLHANQRFAAFTGRTLREL
jgi:PAS domain-containing protein